jgi:hypothetical protein
MKLILCTDNIIKAELKLAELADNNIKGFIKHEINPLDKYKVYQTNKLGGDVSLLPKWAQRRIKDLEYEVQSREALKNLHSLLADKNRDWFTLPNPAGGCDRDTLSLWILSSENPFRVCTLFKDDLLFIGRAKRY